MLLVTKKLHFSASHRLHNQKLSAKRNKEIYGKCNNPHGHGHNYIIEGTVAGKENPKTGMVIDLSHLKDIVNNSIIKKVDHCHLNFDVPFLKNKIPTTEVLAKEFWKILSKKIKPKRLHEIKIHESENNVVVYRGGGKI